MEKDTQNRPEKQGGKRRPRGVTEMRVSAETRRAAERLIADHARGTLEEVLAGLVGDMAEAWERPGSWEARAVCGWLGSHPWPADGGTVEDDGEPAFAQELRRGAEAEDTEGGEG